MDDKQGGTMEDILDRLVRDADGGGEINLGDMLGAFGRRSYGPFLTLPALLALSPLGGVPGAPTILSAITLIFSVQIVLGRPHLWVPGPLRDRSVDAGRVVRVAQRMRPAARWLDRHLGRRLTELTEPPWTRIGAGVCAGLALLVPPLEIIPFAASAPMSAIVLLGIAILMRDGVLMIVALAAGAAALVAAGTLIA